jgi:hypothetical protein
VLGAAGLPPGPSFAHTKKNTTTNQPTNTHIATATATATNLYPSPPRTRHNMLLSTG